ncbi:MAG: AMP-binding protein, partial [Gammaproteobacteria bacterium]|nr:AMP-binding protein [Gammaproteobacteria bacterium]
KHIVCLDSDEWENGQSEVNPHSEAGPENLAYVLYASGRRIAAEHRAVVRRTAQLQRTFSLSAADVSLFTAPLTEDAAIRQIFHPLLNGARLVVAADPNDPAYLQHLIAAQKITVLHCPPSALSAIADDFHMDTGSIRLALCSGGPLRPAAVKNFFRHFSGCALYNLYSPPEAAGETSAYACQTEDGAVPAFKEIPLPVGPPACRPVYVLDKHRQPVPDGISGEICIGATDGVRLRREREIFLKEENEKTSGAPGTRLLKTGDLGRIRNDGALELLGSADRCAWINGFRVDLSRVEAMLLEQTQADECIVLARETETFDVELTAYLTAAVRLSPEQLHAVLQKQLPAHTLPGAYVQISALPLTSAGWADEAALRKLPAADSDLSRRWETAIQAAASCEQAVVITQEKPRRQTRLHLLDLLPDWQEAFAKEEDGGTVSNGAEAAGEALEAEKPAISHGGPLPAQPGEALTLSEALLQTARRVQGKKIFHIQPDGSEIVQSYAELLEQAECILNGLRKENLKAGDKVVFQLEHSQDIISAFWGCILGGFTPFIAAVPPDYSEASRGLDLVAGVWERLDHALLITAETQRKAMESLPRNHALKAARICLLERLRESAPDKKHHRAKPDDLAFFSSTSGSTGVPKSIMLTHRNVLSRARGANLFCRNSSSDTVLNWLPLDHIVGISESHLRCIELGCKLVYAPK